MRVVVDAIDNYAANTVDLTHRAYGLCQLLGAAGTTARLAIRRPQPTRTSVYAATIANEDLPMDEISFFALYYIITARRKELHTKTLV